MDVDGEDGTQLQLELVMVDQVQRLLRAQIYISGPPLEAPRFLKRGLGSWGGAASPFPTSQGVWGSAVSSSSGKAPENLKFGAT